MIEFKLQVDRLAMTLASEYWNSTINGCSDVDSESARAKNLRVAGENN